MELNESSYVYLGTKFNDYVNFENFKSSVEMKINHIGNEDTFKDYYESLVENFGKDKVKFKLINKIFFESIIYGRLTNIYLYNLATSSISQDIFYKRVEKLIDDFKGNISNNIQHLLSNKGFYLMNSMNVTKAGANFIAGYDCEVNGSDISSARFLFGRNVLRKESEKVVRPEYLLGAVEIDFNKKTFVVYSKNPVGLSNDLEHDDDELDEDNKYSVHNFHHLLREKVSLLLGLQLEEILPDKDQKAMYKFCKELFDSLIDEPRQLVYDTTNELIKKIVKQLSKKLQNIGNKPTKNECQNLEKKMNSLMLGMFVNTNMDDKSLRIRARGLSLIGYPTKINYKNSRTNRSATGTSTAKKPIASADTLYSLMTDFENTSKLDKWSMSWFFDLDDDELENDDVIQTKIESTKKYLKLTLLATRHHNKEIVHHVIRHINENRFK